MPKPKGQKPREEKILFRAVYIGYEQDPLPSRSKKGRFHERSTAMKTTYLAERAETAWKEVRYRWNADPEAYRMVEVGLKVKNIVDLTQEGVQRKYGADKDFLTDDDHRECQRLAARLRSEGVEAIRTYSKADEQEGRVVVVFLENLQIKSYIQIKKVRRITE